ncbi:zinc ribbon domain-containing protein [Bordetella petrii]|nr:zinc ribbon domain-containing protein [Bordetella petrii]
MPIYEYQCAACGRFSALRKLADYQQDVACPACGADSPRVVTHAAWTGSSARQRQYDASAPPARSGSAGSGAHGLSCSCCAQGVFSQAMADAAASRIAE